MKLHINRLGPVQEPIPLRTGAGPDEGGDRRSKKKAHGTGRQKVHGSDKKQKTIENRQTGTRRDRMLHIDNKRGGWEYI